MSRTKPQTHSNPIDYTMEWVGHDEGGYFKVYDKETKTTMRVELPIRLAYLDCRKMISGYSDELEAGYYSNELSKWSKEDFDVRYYKDGKSHNVAIGPWSEIKGRVNGSRFCNVVYATLLTSGELPDGSLVRLPFTGACNNAWIDLDLQDGESFEVSAYEDRTKGRTKYRAPVMKKIEITDDEGEVADEQDAMLQNFFDAKKAPEDSPSDHYTDADAPSDEEDDLPF